MSENKHTHNCKLYVFGIYLMMTVGQKHNWAQLLSNPTWSLIFSERSL